MYTQKIGMNLLGEAVDESATVEIQVSFIPCIIIIIPDYKC